MGVIEVFRFFQLSWSQGQRLIKQPEDRVAIASQQAWDQLVAAINVAVNAPVASARVLSPKLNRLSQKLRREFELLDGWDERFRKMLRNEWKKLHPLLKEREIQNEIRALLSQENSFPTAVTKLAERAEQNGYPAVHRLLLMKTPSSPHQHFLETFFIRLFHNQLAGGRGNDAALMEILRLLQQLYLTNQELEKRFEVIISELRRLQNQNVEAYTSPRPPRIESVCSHDSTTQVASPESPKAVFFVGDDSNSMSKDGKAERATACTQDAFMELQSIDAERAGFESSVLIQSIFFGSDAVIEPLDKVTPIRDPQAVHSRFCFRGNRGKTDYAKALTRVEECLDQYLEEVQHQVHIPAPLVLFLSDGLRNEGDDPRPIADRIKSKSLNGESVVILVVAIRDRANRACDQMLELIASPGGFIEIDQTLERLSQIIVTSSLSSNALVTSSC